MQRPSSAIYALLVLLIFVWLAMAENQSRQDTAAAKAAIERDAESADREGPNDEAKDEAEPEEKLEVADIVAQPAPLPMGPGRFNRLPDGRPLPALPGDAPERLKLGVALFRYKGSQAPPESDRTRKDALALAEKAIEQASEDFEQAVEMGDPGSDDNIGWMRRGVLEPSVEYAIFRLKKGEVTETPVDTPRGFWVAKRIR